MKTFTLIILFAFATEISGQSIIKKEIDQLFFYLPTKTDKYEIRKSLHLSKDFSKVDEYEDWCKCISAYFIKHPVLNFTDKNSGIVIWFDEKTNNSYLRKISIVYYPDELANCKNQTEDLYNTFNSISFKTTTIDITNNKNERSGEGYGFYSNEANFKNLKCYLTITYRYIDQSSLNRKSFYQFEIIFYENNL